MIDPIGRTIDYLRVSVTDRCDYRCIYCMADSPVFLPNSDVLTLPELERLCTAFIRGGITRIRITGGEPLVRRDVLTLIERLGQRLGDGLQELTLTTNGSQLRQHAIRLAAAGIRRINISLDSLDPGIFHAITRRGNLAAVLSGIEAARSAGLSVKLNTVALKGINEAELIPLIEWAHGHKMDITLIETMPMGGTDTDRLSQYLPLTVVRARLAERYTIEKTDYRTGGPARYVRLMETGGRLGFITPLTHNFCGTCNRVRLTSTGKLYLCLGQEDAADLRTCLRQGCDDAMLDQVIASAITNKPKGHDFAIDRRHTVPAVGRAMSTTGG